MSEKSIEVVNSVEAEKADYLVCGLWQDHQFLDDVLARCCRCGDELAHRPHAPTRPPRICLHCFEAIADGIGRLVTTQRMGRELQAKGFRVTEKP